MAKMKMILDVEGMSGKRPYNIGYLIGDNHGNIYQENSVALPQTIWENLANCYHAKEMTHKNIEEILADFGSGDERKYNYNSISEFIEMFLFDLNRFKIKEIWAYNCTFDKSAIAHLFGNIPMPDVEWCDIWPAVCYSRCMTQKYVDFCIKNGFITEKGNIKTSAEVVYAYMTKNVTFCEEHTGLADCHIEYELFQWAKSSKQKMVKKHPTPIWKVMAKMVQPAD